MPTYMRNVDVSLEMKRNDSLAKRERTFKIQDRPSFKTKAGNEMFLMQTPPLGFTFKRAKPANVANNRQRITSSRDSDPRLIKMFADSRRKLGNSARFSVS